MRYPLRSHHHHPSKNTPMRTAVFVDADYLYSAGAKLLSGEALPRTAIHLDIDSAVYELGLAVEVSSPSCSLLRVYWYDTMPRTGPTAAQRAVADAEDVKLRLGGASGVRSRKGVDALIAADLIELARNCAITDAILLAGDEAVCTGVQAAQAHGVRVHLLGIEAPSGDPDNQSRLLQQESDTSTEWGKADVQPFLSIREPLKILS